MWNWNPIAGMTRATTASGGSDGWSATDSIGSGVGPVTYTDDGHTLNPRLGSTLDGPVYDIEIDLGGSVGGHFDEFYVHDDATGLDFEVRNRAGVVQTYPPLGGSGDSQVADYAGFILRPEALYWEDQNSANEANRILWLPEEVPLIHAHIVSTLTPHFGGTAYSVGASVAATPRFGVLYTPGETKIMLV